MRSRILVGLLALGLTFGATGTGMAAATNGVLPGEFVCIDGVLYEYVYVAVPTMPSVHELQAIDLVPVGTCGAAASVRGTAYEDRNANGKRDANEPEMGGAWFKVSNGGDWYVCGWVGGDSTYGVPVENAGMTYFVDAIAPVGWRTTTPRVKASVIDVKGGAYLYNDLGFVRDARVKTVEGCDQYHPVRR